MNIEDTLLKRKVITEDQIKQAKKESQKTGLPIDKALTRLGIITEETIVKNIAEEMGVPFMDLKGYVIEPKVIGLVPEKTAKRFKVMPLFKVGKSLTVAMVNPHDIVAIDELRKCSKMTAIEPVLSVEKDIEKAIDRYYGVRGVVEEVIREMPKPKKDEPEEPEDFRVSEAAQQVPVVKLVNQLISQAVREKASDIHIEPEGDILRVRFRVDGILHEITTPPKELQNAVISRVKILSDLDIAEKRKPQDGRIITRMDNKDIDLRVSTFPTVHGENVVMRILDKTSAIKKLEELGIRPESLAKYSNLIKKPHGIILVTGPTGSGKTTTLYASLTAINSMEKDIVTIEDPVEYEIPLIRQTQINVRAGLTFATGLRNILRQDPDVIMVGEVRDRETGEIAIQASLTGHLVFSTLHTNDAASSLMRLIDMGIEPFMVSSTVIGILAQRLIRVICVKCKETYKPEEAILEEFNLSEEVRFARGKGCPECRDSGYKGRLGIYELMVMDEDLKKMVIAKESSDKINRVAMEKGMITLHQDGMEKVKEGITTLEEVLRVSEEA